MPSSKNNEVKFNDGEGLIYTDLLDMQRFLKSALLDQNTEWRTDPLACNRPSAALQKYVFVRNAAEAYVALSGSNRTVTNGPGVIYQWAATSAPDGLVNNLLQYTLDQDELLTVFATNASGNPRVDALCVKLSTDDSQDSQGRDFEDEITRVVSSTTFFKKRRVTLATQVVQGTPAANPTLPSPPAGYAVYCYCYIPNGVALISTNMIADNRIPSKLRSIRTPASALIAPSSGWVIGTNRLTASTVNGLVPAGYFPCPLGPGARILKVGIFGGALTVGSDMNAQLFTFADSAGSPSLIVEETTWAHAAWNIPLNAPQSLAGTSIADPTAITAGKQPTIWGNGFPSGMTVQNLATDYGSMLAAKIAVTGSTWPNEYIRFVEWWYAE